MDPKPQTLDTQEPHHLPRLSRLWTGVRLCLRALLMRMQPLFKLASGARSWHAAQLTAGHAQGDQELHHLPHLGKLWTKLRPGLRALLMRMQPLFELAIYTHGDRAYAAEMARLIDPTSRLFGGRVISQVLHLRVCVFVFSLFFFPAEGKRTTCVCGCERVQCRGQASSRVCDGAMSQCGAARSSVGGLRVLPWGCVGAGADPTAPCAAEGEASCHDRAWSRGRH